MLKKQQIDLRNHLEILQNEFSYDILYNRATKYIKCRCFNAIYKSGDPKCPICSGAGYGTSLEKIRIIEYTPTKAGVQQADFGEYNDRTKTFFMTYRDMPKEKDHIILTGWNKDKTPSNVIEVYQVQSSVPVRGDRGRVEFYSVKARLVPDMRQQFGQNLRRLPHPIKRALAEGKRYVWPIQHNKSNVKL